MEQSTSEQITGSSVVLPAVLCTSSLGADTEATLLVPEVVSLYVTPSFLIDNLFISVVVLKAPVGLEGENCVETKSEFLVLEIFVSKDADVSASNNFDSDVCCHGD